MNKAIRCMRYETNTTYLLEVISFDMILSLSASSLRRRITAIVNSELSLVSLCSMLTKSSAQLSLTNADSRSRS